MKLMVDGNKKNFRAHQRIRMWGNKSKVALDGEEAIIDESFPVN